MLSKITRVLLLFVFLFAGVWLLGRAVTRQPEGVARQQAVGDFGIAVLAV